MKIRARVGNVPPTVLAYLVRRLLWSFVLILAVALVTFIIFFVIPTNRVGNVRHRETTTNIN